MKPVVDAQLLFMLFFLVFFQVKHFFADFVLQSDYMLRKGQPTGWFLPLLSHAGFHGALSLSFLVALVDPVWAIKLVLAETFLHFVIDYWKAQLMKYPIHDKMFWSSLGMDQMLHHLTYIGMSFIAVIYG